ncbi:MAG: hypothetical protein B6244_00140 [Candidatus Cloacimonetes bacterium 4572_55]|nr:MAG: hypothetical protein B6244_00140 [Candidatus Cloacimonetes bacterium 4572_55]
MKKKYRHILIVDDNPSIRGPLGFLLEEEGFDVEVAENGHEAMEKIRQKLPSLIFLDLMMPGKNGYEVCKEIKTDPTMKDIYIVVLTAKGQPQDKEKVLSFGANEYISKPFSPVKIVDKVQELLK